MKIIFLQVPEISKPEYAKKYNFQMNPILRPPGELRLPCEPSNISDGLCMYIKDSLNNSSRFFLDNHELKIIIYTYTLYIRRI